MSHPDPCYDPDNSYEDDDMSINYDDHEDFYDDDLQNSGEEDWNDDYDDSMDGDHDSAMTSCGWGTDEDYGYYDDGREDFHSDDGCGYYDDGE